MGKLKERIAAVKMMDSMRERVLFTYFKSLEMSKRKLTVEKQEIASLIWDDMLQTVVMLNGDMGILLEAGLEVIIDNAVEDYTKKG